MAPKKEKKPKVPEAPPSDWVASGPSKDFMSCIRERAACHGDVHPLAEEGDEAGVLARRGVA